MNISFFVSSALQFQQAVGDIFEEEYSTQGKIIAPQKTSSGRNRKIIGNLMRRASLSDIESGSCTSTENCVAEINLCLLDYADADEYIFYGFSLSFNILEIIKQFPQAKVYVTRADLSADKQLTREDKRFSKLSTDLNLTKERLIEMNNQTKANLDQFVNENNLTFVKLSAALESEFPLINLSSNRKLQEFNAKPLQASILKEICNVAVYKPKV
jgi:hypothetical protein